MTVLKSDGIAHLLSHPYLLACAVDEFELTFRKENGQRNTRETATCSEVENLSARLKMDHLGDGQRVEHMVLVKLVDILARDNVDLGVPITIECVEGFELATLRLCQFREILDDKFCCHN